MEFPIFPAGGGVFVPPNNHNQSVFAPSARSPRPKTEMTRRKSSNRKKSTAAAKKSKTPQDSSKGSDSLYFL